MDVRTNRQPDDEIKLKPLTEYVCVCGGGVPEGKSQLRVIHEGGVGHVEGGGTTQGGAGQQDVRVLKQEGQVVEHRLLVLASRPAEVTEELAARDHHLVRRILERKQNKQPQLDSFP